MKTKPVSGASGWVDPDDAPPLDEAFFAHAEIREGDTVIRPGRPRSASPKLSVTLRLDQEIVAAFRQTGRGWQSRINEALREAIRKQV
ncbi:MAG TPA: BrnA antitoxin family protein [Caulobacteraceae bacterium]